MKHVYSFTNRVVKSFRGLALAALVVLGSGVASGTTVNYAMTSLGKGNGVAIGTGSYTVDAVISISFAQNSSGTAPTYYSSDGARLYQNATKGGSIKISVASGYKITDVVVTRTSDERDDRPFWGATTYAIRWLAQLRHQIAKRSIAIRKYEAAHRQ